jgi:hypothetical protein
MEEIQETLEAVENLCAFLGFVPEEWVRRHDEETVYMIAVTPGRPIQLITEEEAEEFLPCFGLDDFITGAPDTDLCMSCNEELIFSVGEQKYLDGSALIYDIDEEGDVIPLTVDDIYQVQEMLKKRTLMVTEEGQKMPVISLN